MASPQYQQIPTKRKVWVLNRHETKAFEQEYRGDKLVVPPAKEKKLLMDSVAAEKFLSTPAPIQDFLPNGQEISMGKPLFIQELTEEERDSLDPRNAKIEKAMKEEAESTCTICGKATESAEILKVHVKRVHPDYVKV